MAIGTIMPMPVFTGWDTLGNPLVGGQLFTYVAGTVTPISTYKDAALTIANTNPIILDGAGRATVFLTPGLSYKFVQQDALGVIVWTQDGVIAGGAAPDPSSTVVARTTLTGTQDNFALPQNCSTLYCGNVAPLTITGFTAGYDGQQVNVVANGQPVLLAYNSSGSLAGNRFQNNIASGPTPLATGAGRARYTYDATAGFWRLTAHLQGAPIAIPYAAGLYTSDIGTWTVEAADQSILTYQIIDKILWLDVHLLATSVAGTPKELRVTLPNGYLGGQAASVAVYVLETGVAPAGGCVAQIFNPETFVRLRRDIGGNGTWANTTNNTNVSGHLALPIG